MERMTHIDHIGWYMEDQSIAFDGRRRGKDVDRLAAYEDTGLEPGEVLTGKEMAEVGCAIIRLKKYEDIGPIDHLRELAQAEKDGRLVMLPCRVGDVVYEANKRGFISTYKVISIHLSAYSTRIV